MRVWEHDPPSLAVHRVQREIAYRREYPRRIKPGGEMDNQRPRAPYGMRLSKSQPPGPIESFHIESFIVNFCHEDGRFAELRPSDNRTLSMARSKPTVELRRFDPESLRCSIRKEA